MRTQRCCSSSRRRLSTSSYRSPLSSWDWAWNTRCYRRSRHRRRRFQIGLAALDSDRTFGRYSNSSRGMDRTARAATQAAADRRGDAVASTEEVLVERADGTLVLTLNRPEKLNAINYAMIG